MVNTVFSHIIHDYFVMFALNDPILLDDVKINLVYYFVQFTSMPIYERTCHKKLLSNFCNM